jgi:glycosyltransferase involved in cell wall biosynthesis
VATVHDLGYLAYPEAHRAQDRAYLDWSTRWNARHAAAVVADSQATRRDLIDAYAAEPDRVRVVYLGRDESLRPVHDPARLAAARARYGIRGPYFLYVGTLQPRKNLARLVAAFARLLARCDAPGADRPTAPEASGGQDGRAWPETACATTDLQLVLAGRRGWLFDELSGEVGRLELASRVVFPGYVDEADLPALYGGSLALVYPSLYEGFGMPVLEAQSCGVPVMTSNNSSLPEIAGDSALLVDPHDVDAIAAAMYRLLTDEGLRKELIRRGFANVQRFAWEKCARETLAVLEEVAASAQRGSARGGGHGA